MLACSGPPRLHRIKALQENDEPTRHANERPRTLRLSKVKGMRERIARQKRQGKGDRTFFPFSLAGAEANV